MGIVQQYQFVSSLQRASVAARLLGEDVVRVYCKGAPETVRALCRPETGEMWGPSVETLRSLLFALR